MKKAKAAVMIGVNEPFSIREYEVTSPPAGMAKLRLVASGVCGTDMHIHQGKLPSNLPAIIGHEFIGRVEELSDIDRKQYGIAVGDNVIVNIACPCGECILCKNGDDANCINMKVTNGGNPEIAPHFYGGYGEYNYSPVKNLIKIPAGLDPKMTCVFPCAGPTAIHAFMLADKAGVKLSDINTAVVQGLGPVGMFAVMYLHAAGVKNVIAITAGNNGKREQLAVKLGAGEAADLNHLPVGVDLVFEASGNPAAFAQGLGMLRNRGVYLVPGQYSNSGMIEIAPQIITFKALHIIGSSQYSTCDVRAYLDFIAAHPELHKEIVSAAACYKVEDINKAFEDAKCGKNIKTMLV